MPLGTDLALLLWAAFLTLLCHVPDLVNAQWPDTPVPGINLTGRVRGVTV